MNAALKKLDERLRKEARDAGGLGVTLHLSPDQALAAITFLEVGLAALQRPTRGREHALDIVRTLHRELAPAAPGLSQLLLMSLNESTTL